MTTHSTQSTSLDSIVLKIFIPVVIAAIVGLGGWVWSTSTSLTLTQADVAYIKEDIKEAKQDASQLEGKVDNNKELLIELQRDMKYIKITLDNIEDKLEAKPRKSK
jgi:5-bromo-4-chloroindolyl phosphate hydrolysis protein